LYGLTVIGVTRDGTDVEIQLTPGFAMLPALTKARSYLDALGVASCVFTLD
jgi:hypothetical protein